MGKAEIAKHDGIPAASYLLVHGLTFFKCGESLTSTWEHHVNLGGNSGSN